MKKDFDFYASKLLYIADKATTNQKYELASEAISVYGSLSYAFNQFYMSQKAEELLKILARQLVRCTTSSVQKNDDVVLFYDGFNVKDTRGLMLIYITNLLALGKTVIYLAPSIVKGHQPQLCKATSGKENFIMEYYPYHAKHTEKIRVINEIFEKYNPRHAFLYTTPCDVAGIIAFMGVKGVKRYQINLTDHAFWLGVNAFDVCLEFRDYGYAISQEYRGIPQSKLQILPYYPYIDTDIPFEGFSFINDKSTKIVFSGGALYKTISEDNTYYKIVDHILCNHKDVVFIYAGDGDSSRLDEIAQKYPNRVFHIAERNDLYQVLRHSYLYLNTYPLLGGLMTQFAVVAEKIPVTLLHHTANRNILLNEDEAEIYYDTADDLTKDVDRLLDDKDYLDYRTEKIRGKVISQKQFQKELSMLLSEGHSSFQYNPIILANKDFIREYKLRFNEETIVNSIISRNNIRVAYYFPEVFLSNTFFTKLLRHITKKCRIVVV